MKRKNTNIDEMAAKILAAARASTLPLGNYKKLSGQELDELSEGYEDPRVAYREKLKRGEIKPDYHQSLIAQYEFFRKNIHEPKQAFYPCCNIDASPIRGFPNSEVVLMDEDKDTKIVMENAGITNFIFGDVLKHKPQTPYDLVIILNPTLPSKDLTRHLVSGGYALANNYCKNVSQLLRDKRFEGIGTLKENENGIFLAEKDFSIFENFPDYFGVFRRK